MVRRATCGLSELLLCASHMLRRTVPYVIQCCIIDPRAILASTGTGPAAAPICLWPRACIPNSQTFSLLLTSPRKGVSCCSVRLSPPRPACSRHSGAFVPPRAGFTRVVTTFPPRSKRAARGAALSLVRACVALGLSSPCSTHLHPPCRLPHQHSAARYVLCRPEYRGKTVGYAPVPTSMADDKVRGARCCPLPPPPFRTTPRLLPTPPRPHRTPLPPTPQAHAGIQKLLTAEHEATEVVKAAKDEKVARLKQAKAEAEAEIAAYKASREAQFQVFSKERMGDTGAHSKELAASTEKELAEINRQVASNSSAVVKMLLQSVTTVG